MKWKCKLSGTVIDLPDYEYDNMIGHDGYELVEAVKEQEETKKQPKAKKEQAE